MFRVSKTERLNGQLLATEIRGSYSSTTEARRDVCEGAPQNRYVATFVGRKRDLS
jgi:hypothetical protein